MSELSKELAELATLPLEQVRERWIAIDKDTVPNVPVGLLRRLLAQRLQERRQGSLPKIVARELERTVGDHGRKETARPSITLTPGTRLIREWNGRTIAVEVREDGFLWEGQTYRSLSQIARKVTGAHWSGPRFFGLARNG